MQIWIKKAVKDNGGFWTDHVSDTGKFIIAQGYNEWEKKQGKPWVLFDCTKDNSWKVLGYYVSVDEAKSYFSKQTAQEITG